MDVLEGFCDACAICRRAFIAAKAAGNRAKQALGKHQISNNERQDCKLQAKAWAKPVSYGCDAHLNITIFSKNS